MNSNTSRYSLIKKIEEIMKFNLIFIIFIFLMSTFSHQVKALNKYVSPSGLDSNDGSSQQSSWKTVKDSVSKLNPGDTLFIMDGDYTNEGTISDIKSGTEQSPITIKNLTGHSPIINRFWLKEKHWISIDGLKIKGSKDFPAGWSDMPNIFIDDNSVTIDRDLRGNERKVFIDQKFSSYMSMLDGWLDDWSTGITLKASSNIIIKNNEITKHTVGVFLENESTLVEVTDNEIHHNRNGVTGNFDSNVTSFSFSNSTFRNNYIYQNISGGLNLYKNAHHNLVENNHAEYQGVANFSIQNGSHNNILRNNTAMHAGFYSEAMLFPGSSSINVHTAGANNLIEGNIAAFQVDPTTIDGNGFIFDISTPSLTSGEKSVIVRNNIFYKNSGSGISITESYGGDYIHNVLVENGNVNNTASNGFGIRIGKNEQDPKIGANNIISNNIIANNFRGGILAPDVHSSQKYMNYNFYSILDGTPFVAGSYNSSPRYFSLEDLKAAGFELNSIEGNPQFSNPANGDYSLLAFSTAIDAGTNAYTTIIDKIGTARPQGIAVDIGAFETSIEVSSSPTIELPPCHSTDINQDGITNIFDFSILAKNFFKTPIEDLRSDINQDGKVNLFDYSEMSSNFFINTGC